MATKCLAHNDIIDCDKLLNASHQSFKEDYEVISILII